ncbi:MAG: hypothetical protein NZ903_02780 [Candidatus Micrarchaeota archaeon]|nr:hypothetical protein [Candidatus Micrarchaeota archaeon]
MKEHKRPSVTITITKSRSKPIFIGTKSEPIMIVKRGEHEIKVRINDRIKIGPGIYKIVEYTPMKEWKNEISGVGYNAAVKCKLIEGKLFNPLRRVAFFDKEKKETYIELTPETLSYFIISPLEEEIIEKKKEELAQKIKEIKER